MTVCTASDASNHAHARSYPRMRCGNGGLPKPQWSPVSGDLAVRRFVPVLLRGDGINLHPKDRGFSRLRRLRRAGRTDGFSAMWLAQQQRTEKPKPAGRPQLEELATGRRLA